MGVVKDALNARWTEFLLHAINNPLSTLQGLLSYLAIVCLALMGLLPQSSKWYPAVAALAFGLPKVYIAMKQKDAGTIQASTPDNPMPHPEPSTEIPLNPDARLHSSE